ncbi:TetR family transcriptional regulator [Timonella sp. A28]|uniref:TetR family transcriptional regulator n=1 Tax=Timonella sp. A28 TaxID=3442640 RepID=UPI003EB8D160
MLLPTAILPDDHTRFGGTMAYHYRGSQPAQKKRPSTELIIHAAIDLFGREGFSAVTIKDIADQAGYSAPLVIHHFGSKKGLRSACDAYVSQHILQAKAQSVEQGHGIGIEHLITQLNDGEPIMRYLFQALIAGGPHMDALVDQLVDDAEIYMKDAEHSGLVTPSPHPRERAALLLLWNLGGMMFHSHMKRLIGVSLIDDPPEKWGPYLTTAIDVYSRGVLTPGVYEQVIEQLATSQTHTTHGEAQQ